MWEHCSQCSYLKNDDFYISQVTWVEKNKENFSSIPSLWNIFCDFVEKGSMCLIFVGFSTKIQLHFKSYKWMVHAWNFKQSYAYTMYSEHDLNNLDLNPLVLNIYSCLFSKLIVANMSRLLPFWPQYIFLPMWPFWENIFFTNTPKVFYHYDPFVQIDHCDFLPMCLYWIFTKTSRPQHFWIRNVWCGIWRAKAKSMEIFHDLLEHTV